MTNSHWPVVGHEWAVQQLQQALYHQRTRHAYLITGPASIGKTTLARALAMALNCTNDNPPCGRCRSCQLISHDAHPDISLIEAERVGGTLKIDQIRDLQRTLSLRPYEATHKIAILQRFHEANPATQNALLKTLEEPAQNVVLILTAEYPDRLLPTIHSRCQTLNLRPLSIEQVEFALHHRFPNHDPQQLTLMARLAGGRIGWAIRMAEDPNELAARESALTILEQVISSPQRVSRFQAAEALAKDKDSLLLNLEYWLTYWRDVLLLTSQAAAPIINIDHQPMLEMVARSLSADSAHAALHATREAITQLQQNVNTRLLVEVLLLNFPTLSGSN